MSGHVEVEDLATSVLDYEETVQQPEGHRRHGKEIERHDFVAVIVKKSKPPLARIAAPQNASQIPGHSCFRDAEVKFLEFAVDLRGPPVRVLIRQASDKCANLRADLWSASLRPGTPSPVKAEARTVPADNSLGLHDDENIA